MSTNTEMNFVKVPSLPAEFAANTFYLVAEGEDLLSIYVTGNDAAVVRHIPLASEMAESTVVFAATAPDVATTKQRIWWETTTGSMFVRLGEGADSVWVEPTTNIVLPSFAGTGEADTMARSDHHHEGVMVHAIDW